MERMKGFIPLSVPNFEGNEEKYVLKAVRQGWVSTGGAFVTAFEEKLSSFLGMPSAAACQSGTAALHLALIECGIGPGDSVIVPTLTFIAAVNPVKYQYATPIFMDCDSSLCLDPKKLQKFCAEECVLNGGQLRYKASNSVIKAIIVVHVFGNMADMEKIMDIADTYGLKVIEDATEALGTKYIYGRYKGKYAGTIGDYGAYSFNGNKIITTGGGGAIVAKDPEHLTHIRYLSTQAKDDPVYFSHHEVGYNYRMTNVQAAIGVAQLEELPKFIETKRRNFAFYKELLKKCTFGRLLDFRQYVYSNSWFYSFAFLTESRSSIGDVIEQLQEKQIQTRAIWGLVHKQLPYQKEPAYEIDTAPYYQKRIINLPCSTQLTQEELKRTVMELKKICE